MVYFIGLYLGFLLMWLFCRALWFDQFWWLALLNTGAFFLLLPMAIAFPLLL